MGDATKSITDLLSTGGLIGFVTFAIVTYRLKWWRTAGELEAKDELIVQLKESHAREMTLVADATRKCENLSAKWEAIALKGTQLAGTATTMAQQATQTAATALAQAGQPSPPPPAAGS